MVCSQKVFSFITKKSLWYISEVELQKKRCFNDTSDKSLHYSQRIFFFKSFVIIYSERQLKQEKSKFDVLFKIKFILKSDFIFAKRKKWNKFEFEINFLLENWAAQNLLNTQKSFPIDLFRDFDFFFIYQWCNGWGSFIKDDLEGVGAWILDKALSNFIDSTLRHRLCVFLACLALFTYHFQCIWWYFKH